ncbi:sortase [Nocardioides sp. W7]|uniref:sortase domain-containing protein n=1 Tax=Nocardioides sp. W7 TaxID=2931390 RepID=UPI001FD18B90|nr:sortase [Nocardioides sp. W7]
MLGHVGWQTYGTTWLAEGRHAATVADLTAAWRTGEDTVATDAGPSRAVVRIPRFGASYAVPVVEGTADDALSSGFGHFVGSAGPGGVGNYALAGHRITRGEPLRRMAELRRGDEVVVSTRDADLVYELLTDGDELELPLAETWVLDDTPTNPDGGPQPPRGVGQRLLTLTTCADLFHSEDRFVAFAVLTETRPVDAR